MKVEELLHYFVYKMIEIFGSTQFPKSCLSNNHLRYQTHDDIQQKSLTKLHLAKAICRETKKINRKQPESKQKYNELCI